MKSKLRRSFWITAVVSALSVPGSDMVSSGQVINLLRFLYFVCVAVGAAFAVGWCFLAVRERFGPSGPTLVVSIGSDWMPACWTTMIQAHPRDGHGSHIVR